MYAHPRIHLNFENSCDKLTDIEHYTSVFIMDENQEMSARREHHYNFLIYGDE